MYIRSTPYRFHSESTTFPTHVVRTPAAFYLTMLYGVPILGYQSYQRFCTLITSCTDKTRLTSLLSKQQHAMVGKRDIADGASTSGGDDNDGPFRLLMQLRLRMKRTDY